MKYRLTYLLLSILLLMMLTSCADVTHVEACLNSEPYGFWSGLWHGMIGVISFICSLFNEDIAIYAVNNNGSWYDFGFILGISSLGGSATYSRSYSR